VDDANLNTSCKTTEIISVIFHPFKKWFRSIVRELKCGMFWRLREPEFGMRKPSRKSVCDPHVSGNPTTRLVVHNRYGKRPTISMHDPFGLVVKCERGDSGQKFHPESLESNHKLRDDVIPW
jgi:hypothetical protein